jgi:hypothetical protein
VDRPGDAPRLAAAEGEQVSLLRCIVGNPFRSVSFDGGWVQREGGAVPRMARAVYQFRKLPGGHLNAARFATLADVLEDVGCADENILDHLRQPEDHARGCWVVDLLLKKKE